MQSDMREKDGKNSEIFSPTSFFSRPLFLSLTIGVPFCLYKILFGILFIRASLMYHQTFFIYPGIILIIWSGLDMIFNLARVGFDLIGQPDRIEFCSLAQIGRLLHSSTIFLALDTLITFTIICTALWSGWIANLNYIESILWSFATTLNLISLSLVSLWTEIRRLKA